MTEPMHPLGRDQFARALAHGLGRARVHIDRHGAAGLEDLILNGALHNLAYDRQCEDERAPWMAEIVATAKLEDLVLPALLERLRNVSALADYDAAHCCALAAQLGARGYVAAHEAVYGVFHRSVVCDEPCAIEDIILMDGDAGLLRVAEALGRRLMTHPTAKLDEYSWLYYRHPTAEAAEVRARLEQAAGTEPAIRQLLDRVPLPQHRRSEPSPPLPVAEVLAAIDGPAASPHHRLRSWGRRAAEADLQVVAERLGALCAPDARTDANRLQRCLLCFAWRPWEPLVPVFLALAEHPDHDVRCAAVRALAQNSHADIRAFALTCLAARRLTEHQVSLIERNAAPGDNELIARALFLPSDKDDLHWLAMEVLSVFEQNPATEGGACILWVCEHTPCSLCREQAMHWLIDNGAAPAHVVEEGRFDADPHTREMCCAAAVDH